MLEKPLLLIGLARGADLLALADLRHLLFERARRYRRISAMVRKEPRKKSSEHRVMMEAVLSRDIEASRELVERHIREVAQNVLRNGLQMGRQDKAD